MQQLATTVHSRPTSSITGSSSGPGFRRTALAVVLALAGSGHATAVCAGEWLPARLLYDPYLASPRAVQMKLGLVFVDQTDIPNAGEFRSDVRLGHRFGLFRWDTGWELTGFGGFNGQFDFDNSTDSIGWDGHYGLTVATEWRPGHMLKLESRHLSAHIGDEFIERTGRERLDYSREELNVGYSNTELPATRLYVETGWAWGLRNENVQDPWRIQSGLEYGIGRGSGGSDRPGWFAAIDLESMEEREWELDVTIQAGWFLPKHDRLWTASLEYRHGRVPLGEFSASEEDYLGIGIAWMAR